MMTDNTFDRGNSAEGEDFAAMLEESMTGMAKLEPGQKINATILQIGDEWAFLDVGQKGEGVLDVKELLDPDGQLTAKQGDRIAVYFRSRAGGELRFTTKLGGGGAGTAQLEEAWQNKIPVEGRIEKEIKGGYEVSLAGNVRAFCPHSQIGLRRHDDPSELIGQKFSFRIKTFGEQGRNIVVSHRAILEEERQQLRETLKQTLEVGQVLSGTVTHIENFGAFIDIGGLEGLLPISEAAYGRIDRLDELLAVGQEIDVAVKKIDWEQDRFTFSLRDTQADPWGKVANLYKVGESRTGSVSRLTKFGAFITLDDGIDGLLHISKIGGDQRIKHPKDVLHVGQVLNVVIENIDLNQRRISLAMAAETSGEPEETSYHEPGKANMGTFAELFKKAQKKRN
ncbi:MAG: 30S ribosomal protein S1 [Deltaproteobacteria bacterium]|nr:30S ribosomal protein S1 [Deltaproteobacteria bacterium]MBW2505197.1 30S ribosomal protein S1 [Deltaproteobacteria bacterium]MBW2520558.1 30S ribosomal protein S1 [Deltaproteobacteria bacterium]